MGALFEEVKYKAEEYEGEGKSKERKIEEIEIIANELLAQFKEDDKYKILEVIGKGGAGEVYKVKRNCEYVSKALKIVSINRQINEIYKNYQNSAISDSEIIKCREIIKREYEISKVLRLKKCENILKTEKQAMNNDFICLLMDKMEGDLNNYVRLVEIDEKLIIKIFQDVISAMITYHKLKIVHRDIKPGNIFYKVDENTRKVKFLVGDFGIAKDFSKVSRYNTTRANQGTWGYTPPEVERKIYSDIYSLGVVLAEFSNMINFDNDKKKKLFQVNHKIKVNDDVIVKEDFKNIILKMIEKDHSKRYQTPQEVLKDFKIMMKKRKADLSYEEKTVISPKILKKYKNYIIAGVVPAVIIVVLMISAPFTSDKDIYKQPANSVQPSVDVTETETNESKETQAQSQIETDTLATNTELKATQNSNTETSEVPTIKNDNVQALTDPQVNATVSTAKPTQPVTKEPTTDVVKTEPITNPITEPQTVTEPETDVEKLVIDINVNNNIIQNVPTWIRATTSKEVEKVTVMSNTNNEPFDMVSSDGKNWEFKAEFYITGKHILTVEATDNLGNKEYSTTEINVQRWF